MEAREFIGGGGHQGIEYYKRMLRLSVRGLDYDSFFKWGFVRNPYNRYASAVVNHYLKPHEQEFQRNRNGKLYELNKDGLREFTVDNREKIENLKFPTWQHLMPMTYFLTLDKHCIDLSWQTDKIEVDFVGRYENLEHDWNYVCEKIGVSNELGWARKSGIDNYDQYYDDETRAIVAEIYKRDFEVFGYDM